MDSDAISDISEVTSKSSSKKSRFSRSGKKNKDKSKDNQRKNQTSVHSVFGRGSGGAKNSSSSVTISTPNGSTGNPSASLPSLDETEVSGTAEEVVAGITGDQQDPAIRFAGEGVTFKAKLIGVDPVPAPRGDAMCKNAMSRLKAIVKGTGQHKRKILLSISLVGLTLTDEKTKEIISYHSIPLISYISRDTSDSRAFGFVYGSPQEGHQFIGIKTEKAAVPVMQTIAELFTYVYEKRKKEKSTNSDQVATSSTSNVPLSFSSKEEFSEQKVNAAWSKTEPLTPMVNSTGSVDHGHLSNSMNSNALPTLLPPPMTAFRAPSSCASDSRASTMSSIQRSDVLSELRSMRHVINSVNAAAGTSNSSSGFGSGSDRYATWESFQENDYSTISESSDPPPLPSKKPAAMVNYSQSYKSSVSAGLFPTDQHNASNAMATSKYSSMVLPESYKGSFDYDLNSLTNQMFENRPSSARSSGLDSLGSLEKGANSSPLSSLSSRIGVSGQIRGPNVVPSPPSSPRSTVGSFSSTTSGSISRARARPRRGFEQPNQVALPPPSATSISSLVQSAPAKGSLLPSAPGSSLMGRPSNTAPAAQSSTMGGFPSSSEPDLFSSLSFDNMNPNAPPVSSVPMSTNSNRSNDEDKFEANFDAMFPSSSFPPPPQHQQQQQQQQPQLIPPPSHNKQVSFSDVGQPFAQSPGTVDLFGSSSSQNDQSNKSTSSFGSFSSSSSADRYACFKEIQELANIPSVFDQASSGSDSDTFVGSPPSIVSSNEPSVMNSSQRQSANNVENTASLFDIETGKSDGENWATMNANSTRTSSMSNVPFTSANIADEKGKCNSVAKNSIISTATTTLNRPSGISLLNDTTHITSTKPLATETQEQKELDTKYKDTATSPGTPPDVHATDRKSSHDKLHNSQNTNQNHNRPIANSRECQSDFNSISNTRDDPFGMKSLLHDLDTIDQEVTATFETTSQVRLFFYLNFLLFKFYL